jgi:hypothetical protein
MAEKQINTFSHAKAFGPKEWFIHFGNDLSHVPPLPHNIAEILSSPCPFWPSKRVHETHLLVLIPQTVHDQPLTLKILRELVKKPLTGFATKNFMFELGEYTDPDAPPSHWVLLTRDVIEGSRKKSYPDQQTLLSQKGHGVYAVPTVLDAAVCIFTEYVRSGIGLYLNSPRPYTYTICQEKHDADFQLVVGGFGPDGLDVSYFQCGYSIMIGVGGFRKI